MDVIKTVTFFGDSEISCDGIHYLEENAIREALGTVDEYADILGLVKKLKQERDQLKDNLRITEHALKTVKQERDQLKDKVDRMKRRANALYGASCGYSEYSGGKAPAFHCNVISYSWNFGAFDTPFPSNSIRVELELTPTANYKGTFDMEDLKRYIQEYDIFDHPRYRFLSTLSAELGFRTIVGPGNAEKTEDAIMRAVKCRNDELKSLRARRTDEESETAARREFLCKLGYELGIKYPVVKLGKESEMEEDILERIGKLKEGNWPCENDASFAKYMRKQFQKECEKWNVCPLDSGSVHDWVQYIFGVLDEWRKRAINAEKERDTIYEGLGMNPADNDVKDVVAAIKKLREDRAKYKGMLNTMYGTSCGASIRESLSKDALAEIRAKLREVYREVFSCGMEENHSYTSALNDILGEFKFQKKLKEKAEEKTVAYKTELHKCREYILTVYSEIFDCSNGDPEGADKETLEDILDEYRRVTKCFEVKFAECDHLRKEHSRQCSYHEEFLRKLCKELGLDFDKRPNYLPAMENAILNSVKTLSESFDGANGELEEVTVELNELRKSYDNLSDLYNSSCKLLGEYLTDAKDILGIDTCEKSVVISAMKTLKASYEKLEKDYAQLGKAYGSVLKWNKTYDEVRRILNLEADADADEMVKTLDQLIVDREKCKNWYSRYESEHTRANGEHKRAEKLREEVETLKRHRQILENDILLSRNEQVGMDAFRNEVRKLKDEKAKVIDAIGQDIWDDCVK